MLKVIKLNRYVFEKNVIQHNVIVHAATLFGDINKVIEERLACLAILIENLFPASITINFLEAGLRVLTPREKDLRCFKLVSRNTSFNKGDEIKLEQFNDLALHCYQESLQLELDILDIKDQHVYVCVNIGNQGDHYLYGTPESLNKDYIERCKKKLPGWRIAGSFNQTLK